MEQTVSPSQVYIADLYILEPLSPYMTLACWKQLGWDDPAQSRTKAPTPSVWMVKTSSLAAVSRAVGWESNKIKH